ncbi:MAG: DUF4395 family protein [Acidimicrobiia bacterium]
MRLVDVRESRFEQAIVVVVLLAGFVFRQPWSIPVATVVAGLALVLGDRSPVTRFWHQVIAPRRPAGTNFEPRPTAQTQALILTVGLMLATIVWAAGSVGLASIIAAVVAVVAALGATGVVTVAAELHRRRS